MLLGRVLYGSVTTGLCTFEATRLFLGITVASGTDGFRVKGTLPSFIEMSVTLDRQPRPLDLRNGVDP